VDGVVISREVDLGQTVSASTSAPTLFLIANDLTRMQVQASIDEADIGLVSANNSETFRVDAKPNDEFVGRIAEIRLNPSNSQNVVTYSVIITFDNPSMKLKPGMTANITILVDRREDVLSVPNTALRYEPPAEMLEAAMAAVTGAAGGESAPEGDTADAEPSGEAAAGGRGRGGRGNGGGFAGRGGGQAAVPANASTVASEPLSSGDKITFAAIEAEPPRAGRIWIMNAGGVPEQRQLMIGLTDGSRTEVVSGDVEVGDLGLIGDSSVGADQGGSGGNNNTQQMFRMLSGGGGRGGFR
jgi:HlyD family secretion protein